LKTRRVLRVTKIIYEFFIFLAISMKTELTRLRIKPGMSSRADEWHATLNARKAECIETLEREKMYVEAIFREKIGDEEFIYWLSVQGPDAESLESSPFPIDAIHNAFGDECIDRTYARVDLDASVMFLAPPLSEALTTLSS
jgi:Family of unknown function (DUF6176)